MKQWREWEGPHLEEAWGELVAAEGSSGHTCRDRPGESGGA